MDAEVVIHLQGESDREQPRGLFYGLCMLCLALTFVEAGPAPAGDLKIYSSEGVKTIEIPAAPSDNGIGSLPSYRYAGERCLSNCETAPAAGKTVTPHENHAGKGTVARPTAQATGRHCHT